MTGPTSAVNGLSVSRPHNRLPIGVLAAVTPASVIYCPLTLIVASVISSLKRTGGSGGNRFKSFTVNRILASRCSES